MDALTDYYERELKKLRDEIDENRRIILVLKIQIEQLKNQFTEAKAFTKSNS